LAASGQVLGGKPERWWWWRAGEAADPPLVRRAVLSEGEGVKEGGRHANLIRWGREVREGFQ
jgi:hypothetical protein